jgi:integrase
MVAELEPQGARHLPREDRVALRRELQVRAMIEKTPVSGEIRCRIFRHTYTAARLQRLDHGAPISLDTVSRELGHRSEDLVRRVYSHPGTFRHCSEVVEYRLGQHFERLLDQLFRPGLTQRSTPNPQASQGRKTPLRPK